MKNGQSEPGPEGSLGPNRGRSWVRSNGDCGEGQSSGNSDIVEESDKLVTDGEGHGTAQDLEGEMDWNKNPGKRETRKCT